MFLSFDIETIKEYSEAIVFGCFVWEFWDLPDVDTAGFLVGWLGRFWWVFIGESIGANEIFGKIPGNGDKLIRNWGNPLSKAQTIPKLVTNKFFSFPQKFNGVKDVKMDKILQYHTLKTLIPH